MKRIADYVSVAHSSLDGWVCQTIRAHRLSRKAFELGGQEMQEKFMDLLYTAYFTEGKNIGDYDLLAELASQAGIMAKEKVRPMIVLSRARMTPYASTQVPDFLDSPELQEEVEQMAMDARKKGVTGVPFTIINGRWAVSGGQTSETYAQVRRWDRRPLLFADAFLADLPQTSWKGSSARHPLRA